jgi:hypothetical protein
MFKSWYPSNTGCDGNCLILIVEREHSSSHQNSMLAPVGYVQKLIPIKNWLWWKLSDSHRRREHSSSHQKPILAPVGYVQKSIPVEHWLWRKMSESHCRKGTLLISPKTHIRTSWVCSKVDTLQMLVVMENGWFSLLNGTTPHLIENPY